jgi:hypothetical protein
METHLAGYTTSVEEDTELLKGDLDWASRSCITYRRYEKITTLFFIDSSRKIIEIMQMNLDDAKKAVGTIPNEFNGVAMYVVTVVL